MSELQKLVLLGAGNFGREVACLVADINHAQPQFELLGFLDDSPEKWGRQLNGLPILGGLDWLATDQGRQVCAVCAIGESHVRRKVVEKAAGYRARFCNLLHPNVVRMPFIEYGRGLVITAGCILSCNTTLGDHVQLNLDSTVGHDCVLGDFVTTAPGVHISGNVALGEGVYMGTGAVTVEKLSIGEWTIVGAGAVVAQDLPANVTAVGVPARAIKTRPPGWHLA